MITANLYLAQIQSLFSDNKYKKWHESIITNALTRVDYTLPSHRKQAIEKITIVEGHHICPKSIYPEYTKHKQNIVYLTPKEHILIHALLYKMAKKDGIHLQKLSSAYSKMRCSNNNCTRKLNSNQYELLRLATIDANKNRIYKKGHKQTTETIVKRVKTYHENYKGHSYETKKLMSIAATGRKASYETRTTMSQKRKGRTSWNKGIPTTSLYNEKQRKEKYGSPGEKHPLFGTKRPKETVDKIKKTRSGKCQGIENGMYGKTHKAESVLLMTINKIKDKVKNISYTLSLETWHQFQNEVNNYLKCHTKIQTCVYYGISRHILNKINNN